MKMINVLECPGEIIGEIWETTNLTHQSTEEEIIKWCYPYAIPLSEWRDQKINEILE